MDENNEFFIILTRLIAFVIIYIIIIILMREFREIFRGTRVQAKVIRIVESPALDDDGNERTDRFPEIEFTSPAGERIVHKLYLTNVTSRKPGEEFWIYYRKVDNKEGYKVYAPFMWPIVLVLVFLCGCVALLLFGPHT